MPTDRRIARMKRVLRHRQPDLTVVCENIHDPHNVSAILRTCDAVGVQEVHLLYTIEEFPKLGKASSASARKWLDTVRHENVEHLQEHLVGRGFAVLATSLSEGATPFWEIDWTQPSAVVLGNEQRGVSGAILGISDLTVKIPMVGMVGSLNVSVAAAVILYEAARQRRREGRYPNPWLAAKWVESRLARWKRK